MSETAAPAAKGRNRWTRRTYLLSMAITVVPLMAAYTSFFRSPESSESDRILGGCSWLAVWVFSFLATYAVYRIKINMRYNQRPFTPKDQKYCKLAAAVTMEGATALVIVPLALPRPHQHAIGLTDVISAQVLCCLILSSVLFLLAEVHAKGAKLFDELEQGV
jgi:FtsH-binding integral membrane protein